MLAVGVLHLCRRVLALPASAAATPRGHRGVGDIRATCGTSEGGGVCVCESFINRALTRRMEPGLTRALTPRYLGRVEGEGEALSGAS